MEFTIPTIKIMVKPVPGESVQKRHQVMYNRFDPKTNTSTPVGQINKRKAGNAADSFSFKRDISGTKILAGLEEMIANPFKGMDIMEIKQRYSLDSAWDTYLEKVCNNEYISLQQKFEILDGVNPDTYTQKCTLKRIPGSIFTDPTVENTFLEKFNFVFYDKTNIMDNTTSRGRFAIQLAKMSDFIADNKESINPNQHRYYIAQEDEEEMEAMGKEDVVNEAIYKLYSLQKQVPFEKLRDVATLLLDYNGNSIVSGEVADTVVKKKLNDYIKTKDRYWSENIKKFDYVLSMLENNLENFEMEVMVRKAINQNLMKFTNGYLYWHSQKNRPERYKFTSVDKAVQFILADYQRYAEDEDMSDNAYAQLKKELR